MDEAGYTGPDLVNRDQPVLVLGSTIFDDAEARERVRIRNFVCEAGSLDPGTQRALANNQTLEYSGRLGLARDR